MWNWISRFVNSRFIHQASEGVIESYAKKLPAADSTGVIETYVQRLQPLAIHPIFYWIVGGAILAVILLTILLIRGARKYKAAHH